MPLAPPPLIVSPRARLECAAPRRVGRRRAARASRPARVGGRRRGRLARGAPFQPLVGKRVTLYTCGPTVWNYAHIGNFRTFLFEDLLRRHLEWSGYDVFHVMNLTDVDDRTIKAAAAAGQRLADYTAPFIAAFYEDRDYLRIRPAHAYPRATQAVPAMVRLVERLLE